MVYINTAMPRGRSKHLREDANTSICAICGKQLPGLTGSQNKYRLHMKMKHSKDTKGRERASQGFISVNLETNKNNPTLMNTNISKANLALERIMFS